MNIFHCAFASSANRVSRCAIFSRLVHVSLFIICLNIVAAQAQQTLPPPPPPPVHSPSAPASATPKPTPELKQPPNQQERELDDNEEISIETRLVNLQVRVIDRQNRPINNVSQNEFRVFEDGVPQKIEFFTREEVPISYGILVDNSGSLRGQLEKVIAAGKTIVDSNKPNDETFLIRFTSSNNIVIEQDWTNNKEIITDAIDNLFPEIGQTALLDAVYLGADYATERRKGKDTDRRRRALILVTDGEDRDSIYKEKQLFERLRESDVQIFVIGFVNELDEQGGIIKKSDRSRATSLLNKLATETGGRAFFPNSVNELPSIADQITRDLRTQFVISYNPTNKQRDGAYRRIKVTVDGNDDASKGKRIAVTRPGYTAPGGNTSITSSTNTARPAASTPTVRNNRRN